MVPLDVAVSSKKKNLKCLTLNLLNANDKSSRRAPPHRLRPVDIEFMKALQDKVNVVPLIAKADCLTPAEIRKLKERVRAGDHTLTG